MRDRSAGRVTVGRERVRVNKGNKKTIKDGGTRNRKDRIYKTNRRKGSRLFDLGHSSFL